MNVSFKIFTYFTTGSVSAVVILPPESWSAMSWEIASIGSFTCPSNLSLMVIVVPSVFSVQSCSGRVALVLGKFQPCRIAMARENA